MLNDIPTIRSILLTTDLSTDAARAYRMAASLMRAYKCRLTLLSCVDTSPQYSEASLGTLEAPSLMPPQALTEAYADVEQSLKECISAYFEPSDTTYHILQAPMSVKHSIVHYIAESKPDIVVMSSHGRSGIARALLGSVTEHVLRHAKTPVVVVPASGGGV
jgi:nucleotide-binding universal stress UspA family protein